MKLKTKIQLFSSLIMLVIVCIVNTSIYYLFYNMSTTEELEQLQTETNAIIERLNEYENEDIIAKEILRAFLPNNGMIRVIDADNKEVIPAIMKYKEYYELPFAYTNTETKQLIADKQLGDIAVIAKPIVWSDGNIVTIQVSQQLVRLNNTMQTLLYVLIAAGVFILVPTFIAGGVLSRFILRPIKTLIQTMKRNKQGDWDKIDVNTRSQDEISEMEQTFNEMIDQLKDNFDKQVAFVSDASHELKTPIAIIKSYAQLLERRGKSHPEVFEESVQAIDSESDRMSELVEQLLLLAQNEAHVISEPVNLVALCEKVIKPFHTAYNRDIVLEKRVEALFVEANSKQLEQVLYILISNALKYSTGEVKVIINLEVNQAKLQVIDYGSGIEKADQMRVFDRFYRVDKARARSTGGTGLGLAIAKQITEMHGGTIEVESIVDIGSTFIVTFPQSE